MSLEHLSFTFQTFHFLMMVCSNHITNERGVPKHGRYLNAYILIIYLCCFIIDSGHLPTFGPCYINVYGAPQYSVLPDKYINLNKGLVIISCEY